MGMRPSKGEDLEEELKVLWEDVVDVNVSMGCWEVMFRTRKFAGSAAHRPDDLEEW